MLSAIFLVFAVVHVSILVWTIRFWRETRSSTVLMAMMPLLLLWYDCLMIGIGRFIGPSDLLEMLSLPRFWAHWLLTPMWIIAAGGMLRLAGFDWVRPKPVMGAFCVLAVAMIAMEVPLFWSLELHPVCFMDTVRYADSVAANALCFPEQEPIRGSGPPIPAIVTNVVVLVAGIFIWVRCRWPWLTLASLVMFFAAAVPPSLVGPVVGNFGEIVLAIGILATIRFLLSRQFDVTPRRAAA
jgi:hypothetical protein